MYCETRSFQNVLEARLLRRVPASPCCNLARTEEDALRRRRLRLFNLLGLLHQHPVCMPENQRRGIVAGHGFQPNCTKMVGLYGRHHGGESRQFALNNSAEGGFPYGLSPLGPS